MLHPAAFLTAVALVLSAGVPAVAQSVDDLVAKNIAARGGMEKIKAITSMRVTRTIGTPFSNVQAVMLRQRPGLLRVEQSQTGRPVVARIVTSDGAWDETPQGWTARAAQAAAEGRDLDADFDGFLVDYTQKGHRATYAGLEHVGGKSAHHLVFTLKSGAERHVYLDPSTFLERRQTGSLTLPNNTKVQVVLDFSDWREVAGVKFPFAIDEDRSAAGQTYAVYVEKIEVNVPIEAAKFVAPVK
ncbi:MAG: hypothetical protein M3R55_00595 [Acidobacteriota bacterium]|nr:hypothetical protein [Acidobacteriota bacterium]